MSQFFYEFSFLTQGLSKEQKRLTYWFLRGYAYHQTPEWKKLSSKSFLAPSGYLSNYWSTFAKSDASFLIESKFPFRYKKHLPPRFLFWGDIKISMFLKSHHGQYLCPGNAFPETDHGQGIKSILSHYIQLIVEEGVRKWKKVTFWTIPCAPSCQHIFINILWYE